MGQHRVVTDSQTRSLALVALDEVSALAMPAIRRRVRCLVDKTQIPLPLCECWERKGPQTCAGRDGSSTRWPLAATSKEGLRPVGGGGSEDDEQRSSLQSSPRPFWEFVSGTRVLGKVEVAVKSPSVSSSASRAVVHADPELRCCPRLIVGFSLTWFRCVKGKPG